MVKYDPDKPIKPRRKAGPSPVEKGGKAASDRVAERVEFVCELLARRYTTASIKRRVRNFAGEDLSARTVLEYIRRARELMLERSGRSRSDHVCDALALYEYVLSREDASLSDLIAAQRALDHLLGLHRIVVEHTGAVAIEVRRKVQIELAESLAALRAHLDGSTRTT